MHMQNVLQATASKKWGFAVAGAVVSVGVASWFWGADERLASGAAQQGAAAVASADASVPAVQSVSGVKGDSPPVAAPALGAALARGGPVSVPLSAEAQVVAQQFRQLAALPAGDAAIALSQQLEAGIGAATKLNTINVSFY